MASNNGLEKTKDIKYKYKVERSAYKLDHDWHVVHLYMFAPKPFEKHYERLSYTIKQSERIYCKSIEQKELLAMQSRLDIWVKKKRIEILINYDK